MTMMKRMMWGPSTHHPPSCPHVPPSMTSSFRLHGLTLMTSLTSTKVLLHPSRPLSEGSTVRVRHRDISGLVPEAPSVQKRSGP